MYEYIIPQEFNQSDKLGPFTLPQAGILGAGVILVMFLLSTINLLISLPIGICILGLTFYLMTAKKNKIPMYEFLFVWVTYINIPKLLIYKKDNIKYEFIDEFENIFIDEEEEE